MLKCTTSKDKYFSDEDPYGILLFTRLRCSSHLVNELELIASGSPSCGIKEGMFELQAMPLQLHSFLALDHSVLKTETLPIVNMKFSSVFVVLIAPLAAHAWVANKYNTLDQCHTDCSGAVSCYLVA